MLNNFQKIFKKISKNVWKIFKNFLRKLLKMHYFSIFFDKIKKPRVTFLRDWTKKQFAENC